MAQQHTFQSSVGPISSVEQIQALKGKELLAVHNEISNAQVKRFGDAKSGMKRTVTAFETWVGQQKSAPKADKIVSPDQKTFRKDSGRGQIITLASRAGGAKVTDLMAETGWDRENVLSAVARIESYNGLTVTKTGEGDELTVVVAGQLRTRKAFSMEPKGEIKSAKEGSKRAKVLGMLIAGATFEEIQAATEWDNRTAYEGIRLINLLLGYGIKETPDGKIHAVKK